MNDIRCKIGKSDFEKFADKYTNTNLNFSKIKLNQNKRKRDAAPSEDIVRYV